MKRCWSGLSEPSELSVALVYSALSVALTWPLALGAGRDVPGDLGDSLLNMWILGWGAEHVPRLLTGSMAGTNSGKPTSSTPIRSRSPCRNTCSDRCCRSFRSTG